jgi:photosystem II stability/assembly factor-like uncharacterized protein
VKQSSGTTESLRGVSFADVNTGMVVGYDAILRTTNGGTRWENIYPLSYTQYLGAVILFDANHGIVFGVNYNTGYMSRTTDGGLSWIFDHTSDLDLVKDLNAVCFSDDSIGTFVGYFGGTGLYYGLIYRTYNGGATWIKQRGSFYDMPILNDVSFFDRFNGTVVGWNWNGEKGAIYHTTDNGTTWTAQIGGTFDKLFGVHMFDNNRAVAVGLNGTILLTTDGQGTWIKQTSGTNNDLYGISFPNADTGFAVGSNGTILRSTDGGTHWTAQASGTSSTLRRVCFTNGRTGTAVGDNGTILRTTTGGLVSVKDDNISNVPYQFRLYQNYPNPFNPMTTIRFSIPTGGTVSLAVYNVIGELVTLLVYNHREKGTYTEVWNATALSSGIYICRLAFNGNVATQKMLLLK